MRTRSTVGLVMAAMVVLVALVLRAATPEQRTATAVDYALGGVYSVTVATEPNTLVYLLGGDANTLPDGLVRLAMTPNYDGNVAPQLFWSLSHDANASSATTGQWQAGGSGKPLGATTARKITLVSPRAAQRVTVEVYVARAYGQ